MNEDERPAQISFSLARPYHPPMTATGPTEILEGYPMTKSSTFAKGAIATAAGLAALAVAASASAQGYNSCDREAGNRGIAGALVGGGIGAVVGSQAAANHHRTDGSLLG